MLEIKNLASRFFGPVDFAVSAGEICFVSGPSGSGKTLTLRAIVDLDPHDGEVSLGGEKQIDVAPADWRRSIGYLPAKPAWWGRRVGEHFDDLESAAELLPSLGFDQATLGWETERLSSGEGQRLALLRLIAPRPRVLLLDEPCANLDPASAARVEELLAEYARTNDAPIVWVSHDPERRRRLGGKGIALEAGGRLVP